MSNDSSKPTNEPVKQESPAPSVPTLVPPANARFFNLPWGPGAGVIITALAFVLAQLVASLVIGYWPRLMHWPPEQSDGWLSGVTGQFFFVLLAEALTIGTLLWFLRVRRASFRLLGYMRRPRWSDLAYALVGFGVYFVLLLVSVSLATALFHIDAGQKQDIGFNTLFGVGQKLMALVSLVLLPPLVEETLFRGFLFGGLRKKLRFMPALLVTGVLFALPHLFESSSILWVAGIDTFMLSAVLCYVREKTGNLYAGILVHMIKNGIAFLALYVFIAR